MAGVVIRTPRETSESENSYGLEDFTPQEYRCTRLKLSQSWERYP